MEINKFYIASINIYDIRDTREYVLKIVSQVQHSFPLEIYYEAIIIEDGYKIHFYPEHWEKVRELSSLELELL